MAWAAMTKRRAAKAAPEAMTEKQLSQSIVDAARECGWKVYRTWRSIHSPAGYPDLFAVRGKLALALELKSAKGTVSPAQQEWLDALAQVPGIIAKVIRPADLEDVYKMLVMGEWPWEWPNIPETDILDR